MPERLHTILALLALLLGLVHCALALSAVGLSLDLLWFIGSGAAIMCVALSNLLRSRRPSTISSLNLFVQNAVMTGFFCAAWFVLPAPQVIVGGALFAAMLVVSAVHRTGGGTKCVRAGG